MVAGAAFIWWWMFASRHSVPANWTGCSRNRGLEVIASLGAHPTVNPMS